MLANQSEESIDARVRRRMRELRTEQALTLQQVSERANIDVSTLSRLERGERRLALDHLAGLAAALGVSTDELLGGPAPSDPRVRSKPVTKNGLTMWPLAHKGPLGALRAFKIRISPRRVKPPTTLRVHDGHDWMYVLDGRMRLLLGDQDLVIEPGEAVEFSTYTPHWFGATKGPVELIGVFGPHGEREHLR